MLDIKSKTNSQNKIWETFIDDKSKPEGKVISDNQEKATVLCDCFSSVFKKEASKEDLLGWNKCTTCTEHILINTDDIIKRLNIINDFKSPGLDMLPSYVSKESQRGNLLYLLK